MRQLSLITTVLLFSNLAFGSGGGSSVGPANPAAVLCLDLGGGIESVETPAGTSGNCVVEQWQLFAAMTEAGLVRKQSGGHAGAGLANPAAVNCLNIGGALRHIETPEGTSGFCVIEEWTLYSIFHPAP